MADMTPVPDDVAESIGLMYLAGEFVRDPDMAPHITEEARHECAIGLAMLEAVRCRGYVLCPPDATREMCGSAFDGVLNADGLAHYQKVYRAFITSAPDWQSAPLAVFNVSEEK